MELQSDVVEPEWVQWQDPWAMLIWHGPGGQVTRAHSDVYDNLICMIKVRKTPSWPRSWANFSLL
jgi:hypothetical protein